MKILALILIFSAAAAAQSPVPYHDPGGKWGYCDLSTNIIVPPQYDGVWQFSGDTARAYSAPYTVFVSSAGYELFRGRYQDAKDLNEYCAPVQLRGYWGCLDRQGNPAIPYEYEELLGFYNGSSPAKKDGVWGIVDFASKKFSPLFYDEIYPFSYGFARFRKKDRYGFIDVNGTETYPAAFDELFDFGGDYATAHLDDKYGFVSSKMLFKARNPVRIGEYRDSLAPAQKLTSDNKCGYIDWNGEEKIPFVYQECAPFSEDAAAVKQKSGGKWAYIDKTGRQLTDFKYDSAQEFHNGAALTVINGKDAYINKDGRPFDKYFRLKAIKDLR